MKLDMRCPTCRQPVTDWQPYRVNGQVLITGRHCGEGFQYYVPGSGQVPTEIHCGTPPARQVERQAA